MERNRMRCDGRRRKIDGIQTPGFVLEAILRHHPGASKVCGWTSASVQTTEGKSIVRADPCYSGKPWYDWVLVKFEMPPGSGSSYPEKSKRWCGRTPEAVEFAVIAYLYFSTRTRQRKFLSIFHLIFKPDHFLPCFTAYITVLDAVHAMVHLSQDGIIKPMMKVVLRQHAIGGKFLTWLIQMRDHSRNLNLHQTSRETERAKRRRRRSHCFASLLSCSPTQQQSTERNKNFMLKV